MKKSLLTFQALKKFSSLDYKAKENQSDYCVTNSLGSSIS